MMKLKGQSQSISLSLKSFDAVAVANAANANAANANAADENEVFSLRYLLYLLIQFCLRHLGV
jgi:hypothetical protein